MAHSYEELRKKTVAELREIAKEIEHEAVKGYTQLNKEHLLVGICKALNIDMHMHHHVVGINKTEIKAQIRSLKVKRDGVVAAHDHAALKDVRRQIHRLKRKLRRAMI